MLMNLNPRPAPQEYLCREGAYDTLPEKLAERFIKSYFSARHKINGCSSTISSSI